MNLNTLPDPLLYALIVLSLAGLLLLGVWLLLDLWIPQRHKGGPFVPTPRREIASFIEMAEIGPHDVVIDLGSGDGRLVLAAARAGAKHAVGYELHPGLVWRSRLFARLTGQGKRTHFKRESLWDADFTNVDVVFMYQFPNVMEGLEEKMRTQLPSGARVVVKDFPFPNWKPARSNEHVLVYKKK